MVQLHSTSDYPLFICVFLKNLHHRKCLVLLHHLVEIHPRLPISHEQGPPSPFGRTRATPCAAESSLAGDEGLSWVLCGACGLRGCSKDAVMGVLHQVISSQV